jgi:hypothetical protein
MYKSPVPRRSFLRSDRWQKKGERGTEQELFASCLGISGDDRGEQIFEQYRSHLKILDTRRLTCWRFLGEDPPYKIQSACNLCTRGIRCAQQCYLSVECVTSTRILFQRNRSLLFVVPFVFLRIRLCGLFHFRIDF